MKLGKYLFCLLIVGCSSSYKPDQSAIDSEALPIPDTQLTIPHLTSCTDAQDKRITFNSEHPITVLVHGCNGSAGRFRSLAQLYAFHGQQAVCFSYDDRDSLLSSADNLAESINELAEHLDNPRIAIVGHSMGGLVSRKAFENKGHSLPALDDKDLQLITVSAPLSGIAAANHCASETVNWLSLGIIPAVCWTITGNNWSEIIYSSSFIQQPEPLITPIQHYLKIVTNEQGTCRLTGVDGQCLESDYVFDLHEQYNPKIDNDPIVTNVQVNAGHVGIVGNKDIVPRQLIAILQSHGMLAVTPADRQLEFEALLADLY